MLQVIIFKKESFLIFQYLSFSTSRNSNTTSDISGRLRVGFSQSSSNHLLTLTSCLFHLLFLRFFFLKLGVMKNNNGSSSKESVFSCIISFYPPIIKDEEQVLFSSLEEIWVVEKLWLTQGLLRLLAQFRCPSPKMSTFFSRPLCGKNWGHQIEGGKEGH